MNNCLRYHLNVLEKCLWKASSLEKLRVSTSNLLRFHLKMSCFTESFQKLCLEHKNTFFQNSSQLFPILSHTYLRLLMHQISSRKPHTYPYTFHIFLVEIFSDLRVSVDTGKLLKMAVCDNFHPMIFIIFPLSTKDEGALGK